LDSPKLVTFSISQKKIQEILHNLEEIQEKLQGSVPGRAPPRERVQGELMFTGAGLIKEVGYFQNLLLIRLIKCFKLPSSPPPTGGSGKEELLEQSQSV
jgi:hypothetical protein